MKPQAARQTSGPGLPVARNENAIELVQHAKANERRNSAAKVAAVTSRHRAGTVLAKVAAVAQEQQPNRITRIWLLHDSTTVCKARATIEGGESDR